MYIYNLIFEIKLFFVVHISYLECGFAYSFVYAIPKENLVLENVPINVF